VRVKVKRMALSTVPFIARRAISLIPAGPAPSAPVPVLCRSIHRFNPRPPFRAGATMGVSGLIVILIFNIKKFPTPLLEKLIVIIFI